MAKTNINGLEKLLKNIDGLAERVDHVVEGAVGDSAEEIARDTEQGYRAIADTGKTADSVRVTRGVTKYGAKRATVVIGEDDRDGPYYVPFVELGTKNIAPRGIMRSAMEEHRPDVRKNIRAAVKKEIKKTV